MEDLKYQVLRDVYDRIKFLVIAEVKEILWYRDNQYVIAPVTAKLRCREIISFYCYQRVADKKFNLIGYTLTQQDAEKLVFNHGENK